MAMALGSQVSALLWLVLRESLILMGVGLLIGLQAALLTARSLAVFLRSRLYHRWPRLIRLHLSSARLSRSRS